MYRNGEALNYNYGGELVKITKSQLKRIIKEEISNTLKEHEDWEDPRDAAGPGETGRHMSREHFPDPYSDISLTQIDSLLDEMGYMIVPKEFFEMSQEETEDFRRSKFTPSGTVYAGSGPLKGTTEP